MSELPGVRRNETDPLQGVRAAAAAEAVTTQQILERVTSDPALARDLIVRLSNTLREIQDRLAGDITPAAHDPSLASGILGDGATIALSARSAALRDLIGAEPIHSARLPFVVGRHPVDDEVQPRRRPDLLIADDRPFRLSRQHFVIARLGERLLLSDLGSALGTIVNGQPIGIHFESDTAVLHRGENHVVAGGPESPFEFSVSIR